MIDGSGAHFQCGFEGGGIVEHGATVYDKDRRGQAPAGLRVAYPPSRHYARPEAEWMRDRTDRGSTDQGNGDEVQASVTQNAEPMAEERCEDCCRSRCPSAGADAALFAAFRASRFDADAQGPGDFFRLRPALGVARRCGSGPGEFRHHVGGRTILRASWRRPCRTQSGYGRCSGRRGDARRLDDHHADRQEPVSVAKAARVAAQDGRIPLAIYADLVLPKRRIMEIYLNIAEWGPNIYGIEAAAQHHFSRSAKDLTAGRRRFWPSRFPIQSAVIRPSPRQA